MSPIGVFFNILLLSVFGHNETLARVIPIKTITTVNPHIHKKTNGAFFAHDSAKKFNGASGLTKVDTDQSNHFLQRIPNDQLKKAVVIAATGTVVTAICYRYITKWIRHYLYDQYIRPNAPGIAEALGHVLYKAKNPNAVQLPKAWYDHITGLFTKFLDNFGFMRALLMSNVYRVPIGDAIDDGTITAIYFHSGSLNKLLKSQGYLDFTPTLEKIYESMKNSGKKFQVVYVSLDNSRLAALEDFSKMPWYAVPFGDSERILNLCKLYGIVTVPSVVLVDSTGRVINDRALYVMETKPNDYPWKVENNMDLLPDVLLNHTNDQVSKASLKGKMVGLYFGAAWTKNSKEFTQKLLDFSNSLKRKTGDKFEIVYVSNDKNAKQFENQMQENDGWYSIPFEDVKTRMLLLHYFKVQTLPSLILLDPNGNVISRDGRFYVETDEDLEALPYNSYIHNPSGSKVEDIADNIDGFTYSPVVIAFADNVDPKQQEEIEININEAALIHTNNRKGRELKFFISKKPHKRLDMIKSLCNVPKTKDKELVILDLLSNAVYYDPTLTAITKDNILKLVDRFYKGTLKKRPLVIEK
ncbi:bifunctional Thioredoxin-like superfamily/Thioredoxin-like fold [Babesia duncani]|uniref:Bifunctional Thioredoxin-like superfamily/Thioredoxin-like fold n=1 Tax=Babesia duncani TaxID=323732 RepID=A0AAD9PNU5_9APIC|nr:bifunctional Thioredoxin-like superfamily/Thioredoxin-like fold [Babesia duncani]